MYQQKKGDKTERELSWYHDIMISWYLKWKVMAEILTIGVQGKYTYFEKSAMAT